MLTEDSMLKGSISRAKTIIQSKHRYLGAMYPLVKKFSASASKNIGNARQLASSNQKTSDISNSTAKSIIPSILCDDWTFGSLRQAMPVFPESPRLITWSF